MQRMWHGWPTQLKAARWIDWLCWFRVVTKTKRKMNKIYCPFMWHRRIDEIKNILSFFEHRSIATSMLYLHVSHGIMLIYVKQSLNKQQTTSNSNMNEWSRIDARVACYYYAFRIIHVISKILIHLLYLLYWYFYIN